MITKKFNSRKTSAVAELADLYSKAKSVAVVDYRGLKVGQATELRQALKKVGGQLLVTKNTLFKLAAKLPDLKLDGTSGFVFSLTDEISALKLVKEFAKKNTLPIFKFGILSGKLLTADEVGQLAALPDKQTLRGQVVSGLNSPLFKLAYNLNWNIGKLVRTLDAVAKSKGVN